MAQNDVVLLDSLVLRSKEQFAQGIDDSTHFELFCFDLLLKDYELSYEELAAGDVDGGDDGGVDGLFTLLNDIPLSEPADEGTVARNPKISVHVVSVKHGETFRQAPMNSLLSSLPELFDLQRDTEGLASAYNESLIRQRNIFKDTYINLATSHPKLELTVTYACRGNVDTLAPNVSARAPELRSRLAEMFSEVDIQVRFVGASELLNLARKLRSYSLRLRFIENYVSRGKSNYVLLSQLDDYYQFVTDDQGALRRYLFESNVRDYLGQGAVNREIMDTLGTGESEGGVDFWWLNNGVTILASSATVAGKELSLENVQIVNGLQTTENLYRYISHCTDKADSRALLIKVIVTDSDEVRDRIIRATNYQSAVETASLRATDKIQRDIEHLLDDYGWFYDRRKNYYKNQGRPSDRIVSISFLGAAVQAVVLRKPWVANEQRTRYMRQDIDYKEVFNDQWDIHVFLTCLEVCKHFDLKLRVLDRPEKLFISGRLNGLRFIAALVFVYSRLGSVTYDADRLLELRDDLPTDEEITAIIRRLDNAARFFRKQRGQQRGYWDAIELARSASFASWLTTQDTIRLPFNHSLDLGE